MFNFLKKNQSEPIPLNALVAVADGKSIPLEEVPDEVFSQKIMGDGIAIELQGNTIVAPANGKITMIFNTFHAFGMILDNNMEILVHIGIDTVELNGKGFKKLVKKNDYVKAGTPIILIDKNYVEKSGYNTVTMMIVTNSDEFKFHMSEYGYVQKGKSVVVTYD